MRKLASAVVLFSTFGVATATSAGADTGTATISYQCAATYNGGSTTGAGGSILRDELRSQIDSAFAEHPVPVSLNYDTPDTGQPGATLATDPTFSVAAAIPTLEIPSIDGVTFKEATLTVNTGGFGTVNLSGAGVSPTSIQQAFLVPAWSPLDLRNPPAEGVSALAVVSGPTTPSAEGTIAYQPGPVRIVGTLYGKVSTVLGNASVTQPITIDCAPVAPVGNIGPGTAVAANDPYPCRADRPAPQHSFSDVGAAHFSNSSVSWLVASNITGGITPSVYAPERTVTRGQMAAFLWRLQCEPAPAGNHSFTDVAPPAFYDTPVSWLVEEGITGGITPDIYAPGGSVTRAQMAVFLWRLAGKPAPTGTPGFEDVAPGHFSAAAVTWLVEVGVTQGTSATKFSPNQPVTRGQMAVFLDRYDTNG